MLGQTDISGVRFSDLQLPYDSFYVSFGKLFGGQLPGPANRIDGVYVQKKREVIEFTVTSRRLDENPKSSANWPFSRDVYYYLPLKVFDERLLISEVIDVALEEENEIILSGMRSPVGDLEALAAEHGFDGIEDIRYVSAAERVKFNRDGFGDFLEATAVAVNALCYMSSASEEMPEPEYPEDTPTQQLEKLKAPERRLREAGARELLVKSFVPVRRIEVGAPGGEPGEGGARGTTRPHWRRGHWRRQAHGEGRLLRKLVWLKPLIVNADQGAPEVEVTHVTKVD